MAIPEIKFCKNCKHWKRYKDSFCGDCLNSGGKMSNDNAWGQMNPFLVNPLNPNFGDNIITGEDFCCNRFEEKF